jgi:hypothetical protein
MELTVFVAMTAAAVVIQAGILFAIFLALRKTSGRLEALVEDVHTKVLPTAELAHAMMAELRPKIETAVTNVSEATTVLRAQLQRVDATLSDVIDRTRLQVIRADDLVSRSLDRVEETTEMVHKTVVTPIRRLAGVIHGLTVGLEYLTGGRRHRRERAPVPQDEMFI